MPVLLCFLSKLLHVLFCFHSSALSVQIYISMDRIDLAKWVKQLTVIFLAARLLRHRPYKSDYFWNRIFLKPICRVDFFGSDGFGEFVWTTENGYSWSQLRYKLGSSLKWKLSSWKWRTTMFWLQFCLLLLSIASLIACVEIKFAILTTTISHFKRRLNRHLDYGIF